MPTGQFILRCVLNYLYDASGQTPMKSREWFAYIDAQQLCEDAIINIDHDDEVLWDNFKQEET